MRHFLVNLTKHTSFYQGKKLEYWYIRWFGNDGRQRGKCLGRSNGPHLISKRQAETLRRQKEEEINTYPGRRDVTITPGLKEFIEKYLDSRKNELRPKTFLLHRETSLYLRGYFGDLKPIDHITAIAARDFKTALGKGELKKCTKRPKFLKPATVDKHIRNARTIFNRAIEDGFLTVNPFGKLSASVPIEKNWYHVTKEDYEKLIAATPDLNWRLLFSFCRIAALRLQEALHLEWVDVDWNQNRICVASKNDWLTKTGKLRYVPIFKELEIQLTKAWDCIPKGTELDGVRVIDKKSLTNLHRDFPGLCKKAGVTPYSKPFQSLRQSAEEDLRRTFPGHLVAAWVGHNLKVSDEYYTRTFESDYKSVEGRSVFAQVPAQNSKENVLDESKKKDISLKYKGL